MKKKEQSSFVRTADGKKLKSHGTIMLPIEYNKKKRNIHALIVPEINKTIILGIDFWKIFSINAIVSEISIEQAEEISLKSNLEEGQKKILAETLQKFEFANQKGLSYTSLIEHKIDVGGATPVKQ